jgi:hypothetical protein
VGRGYLTTGSGVSASGGRLGWRSCLRKGCGRRFQARRYNQRYCREPDCLGELRRWQAAKRQQKCRSQPEARQRHAETERQRRKQRAAQARKPSESESAAEAASEKPSAWSRSRKHPQIFCDRPGCYESLRDSPRAPASYCGDDCRAAMRQAQDRERKWLRRKTGAGRFKRHLEYQAARAKRCADEVASGDHAPRRSAAPPAAKAGRPLSSVLFYRRDGEAGLDSRAATEVIAHDPQGTPDSRPRPPPAS